MSYMLKNKPSLTKSSPLVFLLLLTLGSQTLTLMVVHVYPMCLAPKMESSNTSPVSGYKPLPDLMASLVTCSAPQRVPSIQPSPRFSMNLSSKGKFLTTAKCPTNSQVWRSNLPPIIDLSPYFLLILKFSKGLCTPGYLHSFTPTTYCPPVNLASDLALPCKRLFYWYLETGSKHRQVACVFFDVKKAFDSVPHRKIISSLSDIGIKGPLLNWFRDYLSGRCQRVVLDGTTSDPVNVTSGVPQGSILGPLQFNNYCHELNLKTPQQETLISFSRCSCIQTRRFELRHLMSPCSTN